MLRNGFRRLSSLDFTRPSLTFPTIPSALVTDRLDWLATTHRRAFHAMPGANQMVDTSERLAALRALMKHNAPPVTAYVVPSEDQRMHLVARTVASFSG
jgi:hypothetical protein